jgi:hypothetical protein
VAAASPAQRRRLAAQGFVLIGVFLLALSIVLLYPLSFSLMSGAGGIAYALAAIGLFVVLLVLSAGGLVLHCIVRTRQMNRPAYALRAARNCARVVGETTWIDLNIVHSFEAEDPSAMLKKQIDLSRSRFESFIGEPVAIDNPLSFFVFGNRISFQAFFRWAFLYESDLDGIYVPWSRATIAVTTEMQAYRFTEQQRMIRQLATYFYLDSYMKSRSPLWLQMGIANVIACGGDKMELARLNRKMLAALSRGDTLGTDGFFHFNPRSLITLMRDWQDPKNFRTYDQLVAQSWSFMEFLVSERRRLENLRAFLRERVTKSRVEEVFSDRFGQGFEQALEGWRSWVLHRGIGFHEAPPPEIRAALIERVIPLVNNHERDPMERIGAIREMGKAGYLLGVDALIEVLANDDKIPDQEVVWSLEAISGLALGDDIAKWRAWFNQLPVDAGLLTTLV